MSDLEALFEGMASAKGSSSGVFFTEGVYTTELKEIEFIPNGYKGKSVKFHCKVLESNNPQHAVGSTRVWILKLDKSKDENKRTMADIKGLIFALLGTSAKEVGSPETNPNAHEQATALFVAAIDTTYAKNKGLDPRALIGCKAGLECLSIKTKGGGDYTRHVWTPVSA